MPDIRPIEPADVEACERLWHDSWTAFRRSVGLPTPELTPPRVQRMQARIRHLLHTDPDGGYVAEEGGRVVGMAQSLVREGLWILSLFAVSVAVQGRGVGRRLLDAALRSGQGRPGIILCSRDPRAMRLYTLAGFDLHPAIVAAGPAGPAGPAGAIGPERLPRPGAPVSLPVSVAVAASGAESPAPAQALDLVDDLDRQTRGASRRPDVEHVLAGGGELLTHEERRGYVVVGPDGPLMLAADGDVTAADLLGAALARAGERRADVQVGWLTATQQWAIETCLHAGLQLHPAGPVMLRGLPHLPAPYLPSGAFA